jgi:2-polyprenyl-3-methyl-5-hydroxy-6-metoxy-1,4-benzoquinol methylase
MVRPRVPLCDFCLREKQLAQDFYASFCVSRFDPVRNPFKIECIIDSKLTVLMIGCAKGQLARPLQYLG